MNQVNAIIQAIESTGADLLFGLIVLLSFGMIVLATLFFSLAVRGAWSWLIRATWRDVIVSAERKALK